MPFLLLLVLAVSCLVQVWLAPPVAGPVWAWAVVSWAPVVVVLTVTAFFMGRVRRGLFRLSFHRESILRFYGAFRSYQIFFLMAAYFWTLYGLGWGWVVEKSVTIGEGEAAYLAPGAELLIMLPFLVGLLGSWACYYDVERAIHETSYPFGSHTHGSRLSYVAFHARQSLALVVAPLALVVVGLGLARQFPQLQQDGTFSMASSGMVIASFIGLPWLLRLVLGLKPLPPGPLRDRLMETARRLNFRFSDILLWDTHGCVANAMVVGVLRRPRYVVLSDRLISGLNEDEVEAVFGHEIGHVKHYHMPYYLGFMLVSLTVLVRIWGAAADTLLERVPELNAYLDANRESAELPFLPLLPLIGLYIFVVFGFLSRRCERQADIFGCRAVSCGRGDCLGHEYDVPALTDGRGLCSTGIRTFIQALEKVAHLNGISRSKPGWLQSWQHSTIARRVEFLQNMLTDPGVEPRFQKRVGQVKWAMLVGLAMVLLAVLYVTQG